MDDELDDPAASSEAILRRAREARPLIALNLAQCGPLVAALASLSATMSTTLIATADTRQAQK